MPGSSPGMTIEWAALLSQDLTGRQHGVDLLQPRHRIERRQPLLPLPQRRHQMGADDVGHPAGIAHVLQQGPAAQHLDVAGAGS